MKRQYVLVYIPYIVFTEFDTMNCEYSINLYTMEKVPQQQNNTNHKISNMIFFKHMHSYKIHQDRNLSYHARVHWH